MAAHAVAVTVQEDDLVWDGVEKASLLQHVQSDTRGGLVLQERGAEREGGVPPDIGRRKGSERYEESLRSLRDD